MYNRHIGTVDGYKVIDLFPYKFVDKDNFLFRDHVPYDPTNSEGKEYARTVWRRCVEGLWAKDGDCWIWLPPKLYYYLNLGTIVYGGDEDESARFEAYPEFRDNEWIAASYLLCCDGFSGFEDDEDYTCNLIVKRVSEGEEVSQNLVEKVKKTCTRKDGTWKIYVEAWEYLTAHYLVVDNRNKPLGRALYQNPSSNGLWLATRGYGKTYFLAGGDASQEFSTGGAMSYEALKKRPKISMMVGASDQKYITSFVETMRVSFTNVPGGGIGEHPYFTKTASNDWGGEKGVVRQIFRREDGSFDGSRSELHKAVILINAPEVVVSTRSKRIHIDEIGLLENSEKVFAAAEDTLTDPKGRFGVLFGSGTGGNVKKIAQTKNLYYHPREFSIYAIPNYWGNMEEIGLFGPASYAIAHAKDKNGNTDLVAATKEVIRLRNEKTNGDKSKQTDMRMNRPLDPPEVFLSSGVSRFDKDLINARIEVLERDGEFRKKARIYDLALGAPVYSGNGFIYDVIAEDVSDQEHRWANVITDYHQQAGKTGELVVFEPPRNDGREFLEFNNLYKVSYDPKTESETGDSFGSIIVTKGRPRGGIKPGEMFNNIVATAKVKTFDHKLFMLLCLWYKAKGQYERNVAGIPLYFQGFGLRWMLQPTPIKYIKDSAHLSLRQNVETGVFMSKDTKRDGLIQLQQSHREVVYVDTFSRLFRRVETWYDLALLYEMRYYDDDGNFDCVSSMIVNCIWETSESIPEGSVFHGQEEELDADFEELNSYANRVVNQ